MKKLLILLLLALAASACGREDFLPKNDVTVYFRLDTLATKGMSVDADCISECCVMVYDTQGHLVVGEHCPSGPLVSMSYQFERGSDYKFYYVCNIGDITNDPRFATESGLASYQYQVSDYAGIVNADGAVPMSGHSGYISVEDGVNISISLTRCVALITIQIDDSALSDASMSINSMKIKNTPSKVSLFEESYADSAADCFSDGDTAGSDDIVLLNNGGSADFYMFENAQGLLLPWNRSDASKFFESGSLNEGKCSYIEFSGSYFKYSSNPITNSGSVIQGTFTYRFYLGGDTTSDFSVRRNMHYVIRISLTDNGVLTSNWRIDSDLVNYSFSSFNIHPTEYAFDSIGATTDLIAYTTPYSDLTSRLTWSSSNDAVATVDSEGCVTSTGYGTAEIKASLIGFPQFNATCTVTVIDSSDPDIPVDPPAVSPVVAAFTGQTEYTVEMDKTTRIDTYVEREDGTVEAVSCRLRYDIASMGTGFFLCIEDNVIQGEGLGDATMYFIYEGVRSQPVTVHIIQPIN